MMTESFTRSRAGKRPSWGDVGGRPSVYRSRPRRTLAFPGAGRFAKPSPGADAPRLARNPARRTPVKRFLLPAALAVAGLTVVQATGRAQNPVVLMETSMGNIKIELYPEKAPITVKNFLSYVDDKFYDGTIFHRVIAN